MPSLSLAEARRLTLAAQGFGSRRDQTRAGWPRMRRAIERLGLLQIDSVNALVRSHYLPVYSRVGRYDPALLDRKTFALPGRGRELFEFWAHEASLLPFALQPLLRWRMARAERLDGVYGQIRDLVRARRRYVDGVLAEVSERGPLTARELSRRGGKAGWWTWHDGKTALEYLFWAGRVSAAARRGGFERVYDLTERVLPAEVLALPTPAEADAQRELVALAARAYGVATETDLRDYFRLAPAAARQAVAELVEAGRLLPAEVEGWAKPAYLDAAAKPAKPPSVNALLSPFDPLVWFRERAERLFGFRYRLEIYTPAAKRRYGYYVLPFLHNERLTARVDLKADRPNAALRVLAAYAEPDTDRARTAAALAAELCRLTDQLGLKTVALGDKGDLAAPLRRCLRDNGGGVG